MSAGASKSMKPGAVLPVTSRVDDIETQNPTNTEAQSTLPPVIPVDGAAGYTNELRPRAPDAPDPMVGLARVVGRNFGQGFFAELDEPVEIPKADLEAMANNIFDDQYFDPEVPLPAATIEQHLQNLRLS